MKKNMGGIDRTIRVTAAVAIGILLLAGLLEGTLALVIGIVAVILLLTSAVGFCPLYLPFKISTQKRVAPGQH